MSGGTLARVAIAACLFGVGWQTATAAETTERFYEELRRRGLFGLIEANCLDQLAQPSSPLRRAELAIELSRTYIEHARFAAGQEHDELWRRAAQAVDDVLSAGPDNPHRPFLEAQRARVAADRGEFLRRQLELSPYNEALRREALTSLDEAASRLRSLDRTLERRHDAAIRASRRNPKEPLTGWQLKVLLHDARFRLGTALVFRAEILGPDSPEHAATLQQAEQVLRPLVSSPDAEVAWRSEIRLAGISRLRGESRQAAARLAELEDRETPPDVLAEAVAERVQLTLQEGRPDEAAQLLSRYRGLHGVMPGQLWFLDVKALIAMRQVASQQNEAELAGDLLQRAEKSAERAREEVGGYWAYRCRILLDQLRQSDQYGPELADLIRKAEAAYVNGRFSDAAQFYADAVATAKQTGRPDLAFELAYTRASVQLQAGRVEDAAQELRQLAGDNPDHPQAPAAHLLWAWCLGRLYDQNRTEAARLAYVDALTRHHQRYPEHSSAFDARWMLAALEEWRLQSTAALKLYRQIPPEHARGPDAQLGVARCYETILERLREHVRQADDERRAILVQRLADWERDAVRELEQITRSFLDENSPLSPQQAEVSLRLARIYLDSRQPAYAAADRLLARIFSDWDQARAEPSQADSTPPAWGAILNAATQLRIVSLAGQGKATEARRFVQGLSDASPAEALGVLDGLTQIVAAADDSIRQEIGELQLDAAEKLNARRNELGPAEQRRLDRCLAQAYVATRQPKRAIGVYQSLLAAAPRDRRLLAEVAELLSDQCGTPECLRKAKEHWRTLESFDAPGSVPWLKARLNLARTCIALREYEECRKLLSVTKLLYPSLGSEELREQFRELEQRLDGVASR